MFKVYFILLASICLSLSLLILGDRVAKKVQDDSSVNFFKFHQNGYKVVHHRVETGPYNNTILKYINAVYYYHNRTARAFNLTVSPNMNFKDVKVHLQEYKFLSNEYRYFPITVQFDLCNAIKQDILDMAAMVRYSNSPPGCFFEKGKTYSFSNWMPDETTYPPNIPAGDYKLEITLMINGDTKGAILYWYGSVVSLMLRY